jgi:hypothetical protein
MLLEHRADDRRDADDGEQRDREAHRRKQLHRSAKHVRAAMNAKAMGGDGHRAKVREEGKKAKRRAILLDRPALCLGLLSAVSSRSGAHRHQRKPAM